MGVRGAIGTHRRGQLRGREERGREERGREEREREERWRRYLPPSACLPPPVHTCRACARRVRRFAAAALLCGLWCVGSRDWMAAWEAAASDRNEEDARGQRRRQVRGQVPRPPQSLISVWRQELAGRTSRCLCVPCASCVRLGVRGAAAAAACGGGVAAGGGAAAQRSARRQHGPRPHRQQSRGRRKPPRCASHAVQPRGQAPGQAPGQVPEHGAGCGAGCGAGACLPANAAAPTTPIGGRQEAHLAPPVQERPATEPATNRFASWEPREDAREGGQGRG